MAGQPAPPAPQFNVNDSSARNLKQFIDAFREEVGILKHPYTFRILPVVDDTKVFTRSLKGREDEHIILGFQKKNIYFITWKNKDQKWFMFDDILPTFKGMNRPRLEVQKKMAQKKRDQKKGVNINPTLSTSLPAEKQLLVELALAEKATFGSGYQAMCSIARLRKNQVLLGKYALLDAISELVRTRVDGEDFVKSGIACLVITLMISEGGRFNDMLEYVMNIYNTGGRANSKLLEDHTNWQQFSKRLYDLPANPMEAPEDLKQLSERLALILGDRGQKKN